MAQDVRDVGNPPPTGSGGNPPPPPTPSTPPHPQASTVTATCIEPGEALDDIIAAKLQQAQTLVEEVQELAASQEQPPAASMADMLTNPAVEHTTPSFAGESVWDSCVSRPMPNHDDAHSFAAGTESSMDRSGGGLTTSSVPAHAFDVSRLPTEVRLPTYDENPQILMRITRDMLTQKMSRFVDNCHQVPNDSNWVWEYNEKGWTPLHSLMDCCKATELPVWELNNLYGLTTQGRYIWLFDLFQEGVDLTVKMYGACTVRTHGSQPENNTPLMMLSKAKPRLVDQQTYVNMIEYLVNNGHGGLALVDNHRMNAVMLAAGGGNLAFLKWANERKESLAERGFNWNAVNDAGRNMLCLCRQYNANPHVLKMLKGLAKEKYIRILVHPPVEGDPGRQGGQSNVHRRDRRQGFQALDDQSQWVWCEEESDGYQWHISE